MAKPACRWQFIRTNGPSGGFRRRERLLNLFDSVVAQIGHGMVESDPKDSDDEFFLTREFSDTRQEAAELETLRSNDQERE
jgi:hypothetical protein